MFVQYINTQGIFKNCSTMFLLILFFFAEDQQGVFMSLPALPQQLLVITRLWSQISFTWDCLKIAYAH